MYLQPDWSRRVQYWVFFILGVDIVFFAKKKKFDFCGVKNRNLLIANR